MRSNVCVNSFMQRICAHRKLLNTSLGNVSCKSSFSFLSSIKPKAPGRVLSENPVMFPGNSQNTVANRKDGAAGSMENTSMGKESSKPSDASLRKIVQERPTHSHTSSCEKSKAVENVDEIIETATAQLKIALELWTAAEQARAARGTHVKQQPSAPKKVGTLPNTSYEPSSIPTDLKLPNADGKCLKLAHVPTHTTTKETSEQENKPSELTPEQKPRSSASPSNAWIRNKRSQFWEIVFSIPPHSANWNSVSANRAFPTPPSTKMVAQSSEPLSAKSSALASDPPQDIVATESKTFGLLQQQFSNTKVNLDHKEATHMVSDSTTTSTTSENSENVSKSSEPGAKDPREIGKRENSIPPNFPCIHNQHKKNVALRLAALLNCDPFLGPTLLEKLSDDSLRLLLVLGTANEYYGKNYYDMVKQVKAADKDCDSAISAREYEEWALNSWRNRQYYPTCSPTERRQNAGSRGEDPKPTFQLDPFKNGDKNVCPGKQQKSAQAGLGYISWPLYFRLLFNAALPFMAFGTLDNSTLIITGDAIDHSLAEKLGLSSMAAAGLGGVFSGVVGIQVHGLVSRWARVTPPILTKAQCNNRSYEHSTSIGNKIGIITGLIIGMIPLLFIRGNKDEEAEDSKRLKREEKRSQRERQKLQKKEDVQVNL